MTNPKKYESVSRKPITVLWQPIEKYCPVAMCELQFKSIRSFTEWLNAHTHWHDDKITVYHGYVRLGERCVNRNAVNKCLQPEHTGKVITVINDSGMEFIGILTINGEVSCDTQA